MFRADVTTHREQVLLKGDSLVR